MIKKNLILIAGSPATGKSYIVKKIQNTFNKTLVIAPDDIKEMYADSIGFSNLEEKSQLEKKVWDFYYSILQQHMEAGKRIIISEYPFSMKQYNNLKRLSKQFDYNVITIRLVADFEVLWERRYKRDREPGRHLSHLMESYHYGDEISDRDKADNHISKSEFKKIIKNRKYNEFKLGKLIEIDMSNFNQVDYDSVIRFLKNNIEL